MSVIEAFAPKDQVAIVTGGGAGIGRGIAQLVAAAGAAVAVSDLMAETAEAVAAGIRAEGAVRSASRRGPVRGRIAASREFDLDADRSGPPPGARPPEGPGAGTVTPSIRAVRRRRALAERHPAGPSAPPAARPPVPPDPAEREALAERLACAFELLDTGLFDWDVASGQVQYFLPGFPATKSVATARVTTADEWFEATHPDDLAIASAGVDRALRGEAEKFSMLYRRLHAGEWRYVQADGKVFSRGEDGRALRVIGTYRDVTDPVRLEEGRHAREASTRHSQFRATLTEFASSLAHELNQPLAALSTNVQAALRLLEEGRRGGREVLAALGRSVVLAERAADVVRAMRQLVQPEGRAEEEFDLLALVCETCDLLAAEARRADVVLRVAPASGSVTVTADPRQVELVLLNLVRNAIEAIAHAGAKRRVVTVRSRRLPTAVRLEVEDTGPGVDPAVRGRIFDAYFTTKERGTGLGLRLCRSFAEAHGGRLVCAPPRPRAGALFILELPAERSAPSGQRPAAGKALRGGRAPRG